MTAERRVSAEQQARDLLDEMEVEGAQNYSSGELVELANLIAERNHLDREMTRLHKRIRALCESAPTISDPWAYDWKGDRVVRVDDILAALNPEES